MNDTVGVGMPAADMVSVLLWPTTNTVPVAFSEVVGNAPVFGPEVSQAEDSPPYDSSALPPIVVPVGTVKGTT